MSVFPGVPGQVYVPNVLILLGSSSWIDKSQSVLCFVTDTVACLDFVAYDIHTYLWWYRIQEPFASDSQTNQWTCNASNRRIALALDTHSDNHHMMDMGITRLGHAVSWSIIFKYNFSRLLTSPAYNRVQRWRCRYDRIEMLTLTLLRMFAFEAHDHWHQHDLRSPYGFGISRTERYPWGD